MDKVGILTFHKAKSYGAMLQAYALQTIIEKLGYSAELINYDRFYIKNEAAISNSTLKDRIKNNIMSVIEKAYKFTYRNNIQLTEKHFGEFRDKYLRIGRTEYKTIADMSKETCNYDHYVVGSDQVWNPDTINHEAFYFTFLTNEENTIAYAPSIGVSNIKNDDIRNKMKNYLTHIRYLSCREKDGTNLLAELTGRHVERVLDPTLLLDADEWTKIAVDTSVNEPYVLCYFLGSLYYGRKFSKAISKKLGIKWVSIPQNPADILCSAKKTRGTGPLEFLSLFRNASVICTDSFHGTAFSIIFRKNFFSFCRRNFKGNASRLSRITSVLDLLGLSDRLIMPNDEFNINKLEINYDSVVSKLDDERKKSIEYLLNALSNKE